jgi:hypothetical protein
VSNGTASVTSVSFENFAVNPLETPTSSPQLSELSKTRTLLDELNPVPNSWTVHDHPRVHTTSCVDGPCIVKEPISTFQLLGVELRS